MPPKPKKTKPTLPFAGRLVLGRWMLGLFGAAALPDIADVLKDETLEGIDADGVHRFHHELAARFPVLPALPVALLRAYDENIVRHTRRLNDRRRVRGQAEIVWKHYQYLALLFVEIYLDRYFTDADALRDELNRSIEGFNAGVGDGDRVEPFDPAVPGAVQLNKLAVWCATGAGKTLLMHANILQYQHYLDRRGGHRRLDHTVLLTPNEGLSEQHLGEMKAAGMRAELFRKDSPRLFAGDAVEIIDVHKLKDESGVKTVAVDVFEGTNLVLVDEGHRGLKTAETGSWMRFRDRLCEGGFSFEYSATFQQAVAGNAALTSQYARCILFNYSYRWFYGDGFGKDYAILNLDEATQKAHLDGYLTACLLTFVQQQLLFEREGAALKPFNVEKPLWVFVGAKVNADSKITDANASDILEALRFLARFSRNEGGTTVARIGQLLNDGLVAADGKALFDGRFAYLVELGMAAAPERLFREALRLLFGAPAGGPLRVVLRKGSGGEIALKLGEHEPFGVINVGDAKGLWDRCAAFAEEFGEKPSEEPVSAGASLFAGINRPDSTITVLIGSKKFTEGWNSWRVSTMGLMNVGVTEGAQVIQLFGRGVRLKGFGHTLKRSGMIRTLEVPARPPHLQLLETLNVFGIRAEYMKAFRDYLDEEQVRSNDERLEFVLPVIKALPAEHRLRTVRLQDTIHGVRVEYGEAFRKLGRVPTLGVPPAGEAGEWLRKNPVALNWYPRIQAMKAVGLRGGDGVVELQPAWLAREAMAFLDADALYSELVRYKADRGWFNLNLPRSAVAALLVDRSWYRLYAPAEELTFDGFAKLPQIREIALALLKRYVDHFYRFAKRAWEEPYLEYRTLDETDGNFPDDDVYRVKVDPDDATAIAHIEQIKAWIDSGEFKVRRFGPIDALSFDRHLYRPLLRLRGKSIEIAPAPLNDGEWGFVKDLKDHHDQHAADFSGKELYLLRNMSRGRGVGFFEAGNFHPDFLLWLVDDDRQDIVFVDPKGIRNLPPDDAKIQFHRTVKDIEARLRIQDPSISLHAFIVANTPAAEMERMWKTSKAAMEDEHIVFQKDDPGVYIGKIFEKMRYSVANTPTAR